MVTLLVRRCVLVSNANYQSGQKWRLIRIHADQRRLIDSQCGGKWVPYSPSLEDVESPDLVLYIKSVKLTALK